MDAQFEAVERRRRLLRIIFMGIIVLTLPFYCVGFGLWATAPQQRSATRSAATITPIDQTLRPSNTPFPTSPALATMTAAGGLQPTPGQFIPPVITRLPSSTPLPAFIPTSTTAPSLTPFPSATPFVFPTFTLPPLQPTFTPIPSSTPFIPTSTPIIPTSTPPLPTNTEVPPPPSPTTEILLPPTDTPSP